MEKKFYLVASIILMFSCVSETKYTHDAEKTAIGFYTWYLDDYYNNERNIELNFVRSNGITTLDTAIYFDKIRRSGFFSEKYIENKKARIKPCLREINKLDWEVIKNYDGNPAELIEGIECNFLMSYNFLFHQGEGTDAIELHTLILNPKNEDAVVIIANQLFEKEFNGFKLKISLEKKDVWLITDITSAN